MADTDRDEQYQFLQETVKDEVSQGRKIWNFIWRTAGRGLIFGIAACIAFYVIQPWASEWFGKKGDTVNVSNPGATEDGTDEAPVVENYEELKKALYQVADKARTSMAEIYVASEDGEEVAVSGIIVWKNRTEVEILASSTILNENQKMQVRFSDDKSYPVKLKIHDKNLEMAIFAVRAMEMETSTWEHITTAAWGSSENISKGSLVICLGQQFGYQEGLGDGTVTSVKNRISQADKNYAILTTDIADAQPGTTGFLFNKDGEVIGIVDHNTAEVTTSSMISAYAISDVKKEIEYMLNGRHAPYLGIFGVDVTEEVHVKEQIPMGIYVKKVEADSPAMEAGIQSGDVIVQMNHQEIASLREYSQILQELEQKREVSFTVKRQGSDGYVDVAIDAIVGMK